MISIENISFSYGEKRVLSDFSMEIGKGDRICIFGKSGSGKTTVLRILLGLEKDYKGRIEGINDYSPSVVFQENRLLPFYTVLKNVMVTTGAKENDAISHLKALGLGDCLNLYPSALSGGMCRRVAIARALSYDYDYLLLDEPFNGLDKVNTELAVKHINESVTDRPIVLVTHSKFEADLLKAKIINI